MFHRVRTLRQRRPAALLLPEHAAPPRRVTPELTQLRSSRGIRLVLLPGEHAQDNDKVVADLEAPLANSESLGVDERSVDLCPSCA